MYSDMPNMYNNVPNNMTNIPNMYNQPKQSTACTINWALYLIDIVLSICVSVIAIIINATNSVFAGSSPDIYMKMIFGFAFMQFYGLILLESIPLMVITIFEIIYLVKNKSSNIRIIITIVINILNLIFIIGFVLLVLFALSQVA